MNDQLDLTRKYISSDVKFYTAAELMKMTGWSEMIIQKMFNDPMFPSADFGRAKIVEAHALIEYFSRRHEKAADRYWRNGGFRNVAGRKIG